MKRKKNNSENGMITVEAVLSMVPFILVIAGIISFINIFMIHNKIQYAMYQISSELSAYTYVYEALGIRDADKAVQEDADRETTELDKTIDTTTTFLNQLSVVSDSADATWDDVSAGNWETVEEDFEKLLDDAEKSKDDFKNAFDAAKDLVDDPMDLLRNVTFFAIEKGKDLAKNLLFAAMASNMMPKYLEKTVGGNTMDANAYLLAAGVYNGLEGLDFSNSELFCDDENRMIDMVVEYDVSVFFFKLFFKDPKIHVVQRCAVPAWLDGDGVTYTPKAAEEN